jgi:ATP-binding cassette subfamily B protein
VRIIQAPAGSVLIGDVDIGAFSLDAYRSVFGFVPQDSFLFSDSIKANIMFSDPDLPNERFEQLIEISGLIRDITLFPEKWDTVVGEKGLTLSGGQKQRVAIARALAKNPDILVLDDALSAVDTETEELIISKLMQERAGKTNIIISNRVSTLKRADYVAVLDAGKLVQWGSPVDLAQSKGFYAEIARLQALVQSEEVSTFRTPPGILR